MPSVGFNVAELSDEELFKELTDLGVTDMGPILATTRKLYQRKLLALMNAADEPDFGINDNAEESSASSTNETTEYSEPLEKPFPEPVMESPPVPRYRIHTKEVLDFQDSPSTSRLIDTNSRSFNIDQHTPSARPSLRSVISSKTTQYSSSYGNLRETSSLRETYKKSPLKEHESSGFCFRLLVKLFIILIIGLALFMAYQYMYSESPLKQLENLARQTVALLNEKDANQPKVKTAAKN